MEKKMQIIETTILNRENTSIDWTWPNDDPNSPFVLHDGVSYTATSSISSDNLTKTIVKTWTNKQAYIDCHIFSNTVVDTAYHDLATRPGITFTKTISTTE